MRYNTDGTLNTTPLLPKQYVTSEMRARVKAQLGIEDDNDERLPIVNQVWDDYECEHAGGSLEYPFYIVRVKDFDVPAVDSNGNVMKDESGETIMITNGYQEEQIHNVGLVKIASRWLK